MAKNILIIDDIQQNVDSMANILRSQGFVVDSAADYASALKSLAKTGLNRPASTNPCVMPPQPANRSISLYLP